MHDFNTASGWDHRYRYRERAHASGTYCHSSRGNRQFYRTKKRALDRLLAACGADLGGARVLDAAGGSGMFVPFFLSKSPCEVLVYDYSKVAVDAVQKEWEHEPRVLARCIDLTRPDGLPCEGVDYCFVMEAIFLIKPEDKFRQAIANLAGTLSETGTLVISDVFPEKEIESEYTLRRSRGEFEALLGELGFRRFEYFPQTVLFNRRLFGPFQGLLEACDPLLHWLDAFLLGLGVKPLPESDSDIKYLVASKGR